MTLEWLRRHDPVLDRHLRTYLFTDGSTSSRSRTRPSTAATRRIGRPPAAASASAACATTARIPVNHLMRDKAPITDAAWAEIDAEADPVADALPGRPQAGRLLRPARLGALRGRPRPGRAARRRCRSTAWPRPGAWCSRWSSCARRSRCRAPSSTPSTGAPRDLDLDSGHRRGRAGRPGRGRLALPRLRRRRHRGHRRAPRRTRPVAITDDYGDYPSHVAKAVGHPAAAGVGGPYAIALGPRCYTGVIETTEHGGYPVLEHLRLILGGPVVWAPAVDGAVVLSQRGGDFELVGGRGPLDRLPRPRRRDGAPLPRGDPRAAHLPPEAAVHLAYLTRLTVPGPGGLPPALPGGRPYRGRSPWCALGPLGPFSTALEQRSARAHVHPQSQRDPARLVRHRCRRAWSSAAWPPRSARILRGKHKPIVHARTSTPATTSSSINADKIVLTSDKADKKIVYRHSGYPGGIRQPHLRRPAAHASPQEAVRRVDPRHAAQEPPRPAQIYEAQGLRRPDPPARRPAARSRSSSSTARAR